MGKGQGHSIHSSHISLVITIMLANQLPFLANKNAAASKLPNNRARVALLTRPTVHSLYCAYRQITQITSSFCCCVSMHFVNCGSTRVLLEGPKTNGKVENIGW